MAAGRGVLARRIIGAREDGRISANSFRLLTARLKSGPVTTVSLPLSDNPLRAPDVAPVNANAESLENQSADALTAHAVELPPFEPASLSEMDVPLLPDPDSGQAATWVEAATANDVAAVESVELQAFEPLQSVAQITLPEFTPVQWQGPAAVPEEHAAEPVVDSTSAPDMLTADLLPLPDFVPVVATPAAEEPRSFDTDIDLEADERQDPGMAFAPEAVVASDDDIEPEPVLPQLLDTATPEVPAAAADDVQPDLAFELQSDVSRLEVQPAEASEPLSDLQLEIEISCRGSGRAIQPTCHPNRRKSHSTLDLQFW